MSIVSRKLDVSQLPYFRGKKSIYTFPETVDDNNDVKPPPFEMAETRAGYITQTARNICRPAIDAPTKPMNVPLKCDQVNSHTMGASLFNAPVYEDVKKLKSDEEIAIGNLFDRFDENSMRYRKYKPSTEYAPHLRMDNPDREIEALVRSYRMPTKIIANTISEPAGQSYRP